MIRIKCPKCAFSLALDDDEAGEVGECTECGARFRVPTPKAAPAGRARANEEQKRQPPRRDEEDEDADDDDDFDDEEETAAKKKKPGKSKSSAAQTKMNIQMGIAAVCCVIILGVVSIFIPRLGLVLCISCYLVHLACTLMIARMAWSDSPLVFLLVWFCAPFFLYYCISNWDRTQRLCITGTALFVLSVVGFFAAGIQEGRHDLRREALRQSLQTDVVIKR